MSKLPWRKFDMQHWLADPSLRRCSLAARGLWMDMLCLMHDDEKVGHLTVNGRAMTGQELGRSLAVNGQTVGKLLAELGHNHVFDRTDEGVIYCRKMVRDHARDEANQTNGKRGGNPTLTGKVSTKKEGKILYYPRRFVDTNSVNPPVNPSVGVGVKAEEKREEKEKESAPQGSPLGGAPLGAGMVAQALRRQPHIQEPLRSPAEQLAALGFTPDGKKMR